QTRPKRDWRSDVCSSDLGIWEAAAQIPAEAKIDEWMEAASRIRSSSAESSRTTTTNRSGSSSTAETAPTDRALRVRRFCSEKSRSEERRVGEEYGRRGEG